MTTKGFPKFNFWFCPHNQSSDDYLQITAVDNDNGICKTAGFIMTCNSTNLNSIWQNFKTNDKNWVDSNGGNITACDDKPTPNHIKEYFGDIKFIWIIGQTEIEIQGKPSND